MYHHLTASFILCIDECAGIQKHHRGGLSIDRERDHPPYCHSGPYRTGHVLGLQLSSSITYSTVVSCSTLKSGVDIRRLDRDTHEGRRLGFNLYFTKHLVSIICVTASTRPLARGHNKLAQLCRRLPGDPVEQTESLQRTQPPKGPTR